MPLAQEKAVPFGQSRIFRIVLHLVEIERRHDLGAGAGAAQMADFARTDEVQDDVPSEAQCFFYKMKKKFF